MWDKKDATVACRMLGYKSGKPTRKSKFGSTGSRYILDDVMCEGTETSLFDCGFQKKDNCGKNEGAGVICSGSSRRKKNKIELRGGSSRKEGNVFLNGKPVCDDMWDKKDATVACRMLGYKSGKPTRKSKFGSTGSRYILDDVMCEGTETSLFDCGFQKKDNCGKNEGAGVICSGRRSKKETDVTDVKVKLRGGENRKEGNVFVNGKPVCDDMWDEKDATVTCRMLGYKSGVPTTKSKFGRVPDDFILDDVMCEGTERSLFDCNHQEKDNCDRNEGAGVYCSNDYKHDDDDHDEHDHDEHDHDELQIELKGGSSSLEGNVFVNGKPVCDDMWDYDDATVACRMLGYSSGIPTIKSRFGSVPSDYSMDDVACDGTENSLLDCGYKKQDNCGRGEGAGVICEETKKADNEGYGDDEDHDHNYDADTIELRGGSVPPEGNVFLNGKPVCDDKWDKKSATVACRMLGYKSGLPTRHSRFGAVPSEFALDDVVCTGTENNLYDCHHKLHDNCDASEGAGVICQGYIRDKKKKRRKKNKQRIELKGGSNSQEGNLFVNGRPVCDDMWDDDDATVVCRMLGFASGTHTIRSRFGSVPTNYALDDVTCDGTEESLFDCGYKKKDNCGRGEGAGVICQKTKKEDNYHEDDHDHDHEHEHNHNCTIELKGGHVHNEGNVYIDGKPVCDDKWGKDDATVACRMLGYTKGVATSRSRYGSVPTDFALDDLMCNGSEESLYDCDHSPNANCGSEEGAGVICEDDAHTPPPSPIKTTQPHGDLLELQGGNSRREGNVFLNGRPICDDSWTQNDADVVCRILGFPAGGAATTNGRYGRVDPSYIMDDVKCAGDETSLYDCRFTNEHDCSESEAAGVKCTEG